MPITTSKHLIEIRLKITFQKKLFNGTDCHHSAHHLFNLTSYLYSNQQLPTIWTNISHMNLISTKHFTLVSQMLGTQWSADLLPTYTHTNEFNWDIIAYMCTDPKIQPLTNFFWLRIVKTTLEALLFKILANLYYNSPEIPPFVV